MSTDLTPKPSKVSPSSPIPNVDTSPGTIHSLFNSANRQGPLLGQEPNKTEQPTVRRQSREAGEGDLVASRPDAPSCMRAGNLCFK
jgi:hypothetical protein